MPTLRDYSVKFGRDPVQGLEGKNVFPYFYSLVNHNDIAWKPALLTDIADIPVSPEVGDRFTSNETGGPYTKGNIYQWTGIAWAQSGPDLSTYTILCPASAITPYYVRLDPDYNYKLMAIKYGVYAINPVQNYPVVMLENAVLDGSGVPVSNYLEHPMPGERYSSNIRVSLSVQGSGSQTLFGGQNVQAINGGADRIPLAVETMQGYEYGLQALRCEYLAPLQGILSFEFTNTHRSKDLYVAAMIYGFKIRL